MPPPSMTRACFGRSTLVAWWAPGKRCASVARKPRGLTGTRRVTPRGLGHLRQRGGDRGRRGGLRDGCDHGAAPPATPGEGGRSSPVVLRSDRRLPPVGGGAAGRRRGGQRAVGPAHLLRQHPGR